VLVSESFPEFSQELQDLLRTEGEVGLAEQGLDLKLFDRCRCGDDFCATRYAQPKPQGSYGFGHRNVALSPKTGMIILDVVDAKIACIEVLYRDEIRQKLLEILP
jgi:hypothetical protein